MGRDAQRHEPLPGGLAISQASHGPASKHYGARRLGRSVQEWSAVHQPPTTRRRPNEELMKIEDYALIGDLRTSALVGRNGSIDWLCLPRTDSAACFAALLGSEENGRWLLSPSAPVRRVSRRYREGTLILETDFETDAGTARVIDFMPLRDGSAPQLVRIVEGLHGEVAMHMQFIARFDYG